MKKTKLLVGFVLFCIALSFFSVVFADDSRKITITSGLYKDSQPDDGGIIYGDNRASIDYPPNNILNANNDVGFTVSTTGVYTFVLTNTNGNYCSDYKIYTGSWGEAQAVNIAAYKNGDSYELFSPTSSNGNTTVKVFLYAGQQYTVTNLDGSYGRMEIIYSSADNARETYESDYSSYLRTKKNNSNPGNHETPDSSHAIPDDSDIVVPTTDTATAASSATENLFEKYFVKLLLSVGDFFLKLLSDIVGGDVTITKIIYNGASSDNKIPSLNPNMFDHENRSALAGIDVSEVINDWFDFFRAFAFVFYIVTLLGMGIHILINSTGQGMAKVKSLLIEWSKGVLLLILMPFCIKFLFELNDAFVKTIYDKGNGIGSGGESISFTDGSEWSIDVIEFRSPEYVSIYTGTVALGSDAATISYINSLQTYKDNFDLMRICRAYAGATWKLGYTIIWYILIGQLLVFIVLYFKRYFTILFLIAAFPIMCLFHAISLLRGMNKSPEIMNWFKKLTEQIFTQTIHAIIYAIITGTCISLFKQSIQSGGSINWLLMIVAINFVPEGEKILKRIMSKIGGAGGISDQAKGLKGAVGRVAGQAKKLIGGAPKE